MSLANCPSCGSDDVRLTRRKLKHDNKVACRACGLRGPAHDPDGDKWNRLALAAADAAAWAQLRTTVAQTLAETGESTVIDLVELENAQRAKRGLA